MRPTTLGLEVDPQSVEDIDQCLHEMAYLTSLQESIEAPIKAKIEALKSEAQERMVIDVDGQTLTIKHRWDSLKNSVFRWCQRCLKKHLPEGKKSLSLAHGALKTRKNEAAVRIVDGKTEAAVATEIATSGGLCTAIDELLDAELILEGTKTGIYLRNLITVQFSLAKDPIKQEWLRKPDVRELLKNLSISVEESEQFTIAPAKVQLATTES